MLAHRTAPFELVEVVGQAAVGPERGKFHYSTPEAMLTTALQQRSPITG